MDSLFPKTISAWNVLISLKLSHWLYFDQIFLTISVHLFRIIERSCGIEKQKEDRVIIPGASIVYYDLDV